MIKLKNKIDLLKLNIKETVYDILNIIIVSNNLNNIKSFLTQYHKSIKNTVELRTESRSEFKEQFYSGINYDFL